MGRLSASQPRPAMSARYPRTVRRHHLVKRIYRILCVSLPIMLAFAGGRAPLKADSPAWIEPHALNVTDLAGQVPDWVLRDHIIAYSGGGGLAQFVSSEWQGDKLRITVRLNTRRSLNGGRWITTLALLGQRAMYDHMGSAAPESWLRLYDGATELTRQIVWGYILDPSLAIPLASASAYERYPRRTEFSFPEEAEGRRIPANYGGEIVLYEDYPVLTGVFTVRPGNRPQVTYVGQQEATFQSYIGPGWVGAFQPLMEQLRCHYADRHPRIRLNIPAGANYILFVYPPMPFDVYDGTRHNLLRPIAGTVRLAPDEGMLSQDLSHGGAFPLQVAWQDADQSGGPYLSLLPPIDRITPPEYVVPAGIAYQPCFLSGDCSGDILQQIYEAVMPLRIVYLRVQPSYEDTLALPLRVADDTWAGLLIGTSWNATGRTLFLPLLRGFRPRPERPLGFFDTASGRMVGYLAP